MNSDASSSTARQVAGHVPQAKWNLVLLAALTVINLVNYMDRYLLAGILTPIKLDLALSDAQLGRVGTAFMFGYVSTSPIFGWLGDRFNKVKLILVGLICWNVAVWMTSGAQSVGQLMTWRALVGIGEASYVAAVPSLLAGYFMGTRLNNALTIFYTAIPLGSAFGFILGSGIAQKIGWRQSFQFSGVLGSIMIVMFVYLFIFKDVAVRSKGAAVETVTSACERLTPPIWADYKGLLRNGRYLSVVLGYSSYAFVLTGYGFWGPVFFQRHFGLGVEESSAFFGVALACSGLFGTLAGGFIGTALAKVLSAGYSILLAVSVLLALPCTYGLLTTTDLLTAKVLLVACMVLLFLGTGPVTTIVVDIVEPRMRTSAVGLSTFLSYTLGSLWSAEVIGRFADHAHGDLRFAMLMTMPFALVLTIGCWAWSVLLESRQKLPAEFL